MKKILSLFLIVCMLSVFAGCSVGSAALDKLHVVCTIFPQYDFVRAVAGDLVENTLLLPVGSESHAYDPTPADMLEIADADLFVVDTKKARTGLSVRALRVMVLWPIYSALASALAASGASAASGSRMTTR